MLNSLRPQLHRIGWCVVCLVYKSASCSWRNHMKQIVVLKCLSLAVLNTKKDMKGTCINDTPTHTTLSLKQGVIVTSNTHTHTHTHTHSLDQESKYMNRADTRRTGCTTWSMTHQRTQHSCWNMVWLWRNNTHWMKSQSAWIVRTHAEPDARCVLFRLRLSAMYTN